jgi:AcrR family transcriptional regulator
VGVLEQVVAYTPRQQKLVDDLEQLILTQGFRGLTVADLAASLRCSRRTLYEVADSKEALVLLVIDRLFTRVGATAHAAALEQATHLGRITAFLIRGLGELRSITMRFAEDVAEDPAAQALVTKHYAHAAVVVADMIRDGQSADEIAEGNPMLLAITLRSSVERLLDPAVLRATGLTYAAAMEDYLTFVARGLGRGPGRAG